MAITSDNSSPPATSSESIQSKEVQLHDNGVLAGTAVANPNGAWQLMLNNLTEGSHIMTASSGGTVSNDWVVNVQARSGFEDWVNFPVSNLETKFFYFGRSGLIVCPIWSYNPIRTTIKNLNQSWVLAVTNISTASPSILGFILPVNANRVTVTIAQRFRPYPPECELRFFTDDGFGITKTYNGEVGDQTFLFDRPIRYIHWKNQNSDFVEFNLSKIAWSTV